MTLTTLTTLKRVFITGASTGIGEGLARHYAKTPGAVIGLVARRRELLVGLAGDLTKSGAVAQIFAGSVEDTAFMVDAIATFGAADLVIANAGRATRKKIFEGDAEDAADLMRINVIGVTNTILPFVPLMIAQKSGVLSAVSSFAGHRALPGRVCYCASKAAVIALMDGLRIELGGTGVHAMTFCPGFVRTPLTGSLTNMRFVIDVDDAVRAMSSAVDKRAKTVTFPWQMNALKELVKRAPEALIREIPKPKRSTSS